MSQESNNLLLKLHRYSHRQNENFITESFVHLLVHLIESEPTIGKTLLDKLSSNKLQWSKEESKRISIQSQIKTDEGIPDIEVRSIDKLMYIEVKVESDFSHNQIKRYKNVLKKSDFIKKRYFCSKLAFSYYWGWPLVISGVVMKFPWILG